ncbi:MAG: zinc-binding dehydrogenase [Lentisphaeria bacterium]|nr:zinc-binding dehydrogenase [Lentisphaeria bacterium]
MQTLKVDGNAVVRVVEAPEPTPGPGQVVVRTLLSALCGSELKAYRGAGMAQGNGGHEAVGVVHAVGEGVTRVAQGDRVGVSAICGCGRPDCPECQLGQSTWCPRKKFLGSMHAEFFVTMETGCLRIPAGMPDEVAVLVSGDGLGVPYHTSLKLNDPGIATLAVFGLGPIGLGNVLLQSHLGRRVLAVDPIASRREYATRLGAAAVIDPAGDDAVAQIRALTDGKGVDVAIEAAGIPATAKACFRSVRTAGTVVFNGEQGPLELSPSEDFIRRDVHAVGSWFFQVGEFDAMVDLYRGGLRVQDLVSKVSPFAEAPEAFRCFAGGQPGKVLLDMR